MAVLDSISALITLVTYQSIADRRFDANQQLVGQGIGGVVVASFGGLTTSGTLARATMNYNAGGRSRVSGVVNAVVVLLLVVVLAQPFALIPKAAVAGLIMVTAARLFDPWTVGQVKEVMRTDATQLRDNYLAMGLMLFVIGVGVFANLVAAVGAGVALSVIVFVAEMSRSPVRRVRSGAAVHSAKRRPRRLTELLAAEGHRIAILELEGTIFFGSSDSLATRAEDLAEEGAEFVLLDLKRVRTVDATGYKVLGQTFQRLPARGATLAFSYVPSGGLRAEIAEELIANGVSEDDMFESTDEALEFFEEDLLTKLGASEGHPDGWTLMDFGRSWGLEDEECGVLWHYVTLLSFDDGDFVFKEGDTGRSMCMLARGSADVSIPLLEGEGRRRRLGTFTQGTIFGEMALIDGRPRAAGVRATGSLKIFELSYAAFKQLHAKHPSIAMKVQGAIGSILTTRLRSANALILELDS